MSLNRPKIPETKVTVEQAKREMQARLVEERKLLDELDGQLRTSSYLASARVLFPANVATPGQEFAKEAAKPAEKTLEERLEDAQKCFRAVAERLEESKKERDRLIQQREELDKQIKKLDQKIPQLVKEHDEAVTETNVLITQVNEKRKKEGCSIS